MKKFAQKSRNSCTVNSGGVEEITGRSKCCSFEINTNAQINDFGITLITLILVSQIIKLLEFPHRAKSQIPDTRISQISDLQISVQ